MWPYSPKRVTLILFMKFWFLHTCKEHPFFLQMIPKLCKSAYRLKKLLIKQSGYRREFYSEKLFWVNSFRIQQYYSSYNLKCLKVSKTSNLIIKSNVIEQKNAWSIRLWWKPKINIFDLQIENRRLWPSINATRFGRKIAQVTLWSMRIWINNEAVWTGRDIENRNANSLTVSEAYKP